MKVYSNEQYLEEAASEITLRVISRNEHWNWCGSIAVLLSSSGTDLRVPYNTVSNKRKTCKLQVHQETNKTSFDAGIRYVYLNVLARSLGTGALKLL